MRNLSLNYLSQRKTNIARTGILLPALTLLALSACGGSGGDSPSTAATPTTVSSTSTTVSTSSEESTSAESNTSGTVSDGQTTVPAETASGDTALREAGQNAYAPYSVVINGHTHVGGRSIVSDDFTPFAFDSTPTAAAGSIRAYRQKHSIIAGYLGAERTLAQDGSGQAVKVQDPMNIGLVAGNVTRTLPETGKYNYAGQAFSGTETGRLNYQVDFDTRKGSGSITGIQETGTITLQEAEIKNTVHDNALGGSRTIGHGISGKAHIEKQPNGGDYALTFFGSNAEEIGGVVYHAGGEIGAGGAKQ